MVGRWKQPAWQEEPWWHGSFCVRRLCHQILSPSVAANPASWWRSSAVCKSLVARSTLFSHVWWCFAMYMGKAWRMWYWVWSACLHLHRDVSETPIFFRCAFRPQCPVRRLKMVCLLGSLQVLYGVKVRLVAVVAGPVGLELAVEQRLNFLVHNNRIVCISWLPALASWLVCSVLARPTWTGTH